MTEVAPDHDGLRTVLVWLSGESAEEKATGLGLN